MNGRKISLLRKNTFHLFLMKKQIKLFIHYSCEQIFFSISKSADEGNYRLLGMWSSWNYAAELFELYIIASDCNRYPVFFFLSLLHAELISYLTFRPLVRDVVLPLMFILSSLIRVLLGRESHRQHYKQEVNVIRNTHSLFRDWSLYNIHMNVRPNVCWRHEEIWRWRKQFTLLLT